MQSRYAVNPSGLGAFAASHNETQAASFEKSARIKRVSSVLGNFFTMTSKAMNLLAGRLWKARGYKS
jgi:hypothetical protein